MHDKFLFGAYLEHIAYRGEYLAVCAQYFDALGGILEMLDVVVASNVGNHTTRPKPPCIRHIQFTASGLILPTEELRTMPPKTLSPATCLRANQARSAVLRHDS